MQPTKPFLIRNAVHFWYSNTCTLIIWCLLSRIFYKKIRSNRSYLFTFLVSFETRNLSMSTRLARIYDSSDLASQLLELWVYSISGLKAINEIAEKNQKMMWLADLSIKKTPKELGMLGLTSNPSTPEAVSGYQDYFWDIVSKKQSSSQLFKITINIPKSKINKGKKKKKRVLENKWQPKDDLNWKTQPSAKKWALKLKNRSAEKLCTSHSWGLSLGTLPFFL